ncbi:M81 family metallopeptidase [Novosphingobium sp.]|uniref:M81 family metallopeptidase n=1 Tax=Novosphingobium sp. TaxID=1874826 RepID=UPI0031CDF6DE
MKRRSFLRSAGTGAIAAMTVGAPLAQGAPLVEPLGRMPRIAFGGIASECSTYSNIRQVITDANILRGEALAANERFAFLKRYEMPFLPTLVAVFPSGGPLARATYEAIKADYLDRLKALLPLDGVYLPMHGALAVDGMEDAEGDWYEATRKLVGPACILSASYDLHGNFSRKIVDTLDAMSAYRTAPHVDRVETMMRATDMLTHALRTGERPSIVWASIPIVLPGEQTSTEWEPGRRLWSDLSEYNRLSGILDVTTLVGYVWADEPRSAASIVVTGTNRAMQTLIATELASRYWAARREFRFDFPTGTIAQTLAQAMASQTHPVIISDSGDNPGGGGNADQSFFLQAVLDAGAKNVLLGGMTDKPATDACYAAGVGATIPLSVGATLDPIMCKPVKVEATVKYLAKAADPADREAVISFRGVTMTLAARRRAYHEADAFRSLGEEPLKYDIVVLKCGYLAPTMKPLANPHLMALSPGAIDQDILHLANKRRGPRFPWQPDLPYVPQPYFSPR